MLVVLDCDAEKRSDEASEREVRNPTPPDASLCPVLQLGAIRVFTELKDPILDVVRVNRPQYLHPGYVPGTLGRASRQGASSPGQ